MTRILTNGYSKQAGVWLGPRAPVTVTHTHSTVLILRNPTGGLFAVDRSTAVIFQYTYVLQGIYYEIYYYYSGHYIYLL